MEEAMTLDLDHLERLRPGEVTEVIRDGHIMHVTATRETGIHTGRRRYMVECVTCRETVHEATTGPIQNVELHLRDKAR